MLIQSTGKIWLDITLISIGLLSMIITAVVAQIEYKKEQTRQK